MGEGKRASKYTDLDLWVGRNPEGEGYRVQASAAGRMEWTDFKEPFKPEELEALRDAVSCGSSRDIRKHAHRRLSARELGRRLYETVFVGPVRDLLNRALPAQGSGQGLRIRLRLRSGSPETSEWPWELLCSPKEFLSLSPRTPVVRHLEHGNPLSTLHASYPLRVLVIVSIPQGCEPLDAEQELSEIRDALGLFGKLGLVKVERLENPTRAALEDRLDGKPVHVLHFIGHGTFDVGRGEGALLFQNQDGGVRPVTEGELAALIGDHESIRLVVLNACQGARGSTDDLFAGVAQRLVRQRIPAVVAMQYPIADALAVTFSRRFYRALAVGRSVDWAVTRARKAMYAAGEGLDWAIPVLFLSAKDGYLFRWKPSRGLLPILTMLLVLFLGLRSWLSRPVTFDLSPVHYLPASSYCPPTEKVGMEFVRIHPGSFRMGSEDGEADERPVHDVTISRQYCLGIHEVTQEQWKKVMGPNSVDSKIKGDKLPVSSVSWNEIQDFIQRMNDMEGKQVYRLATEAEWEYAARDPKGESNCLDRQDGLLPVGSLPANSLGLHDMFGNVWEMVGDWYGPYMGIPVTDPTGPEMGTERVKRGGGHDSAMKHCRPASRNPQDPERSVYDLGFRIARDVR